MDFLHTDIPELRGYDSGIVLGNLSRVQAHALRIGEQTLAGLWALADAVLHDSGGDPDMTDSILLSLQNGGEDDGSEMPEHLLPEDRGLLEKLGRQSGVYMRLILYRFLHEKQGAGSDALLRPLPHTAGDLKNRISYMKSAPADKAYLRVSAVLPDCRFSQAHSFIDACEEVYGGFCRFCLFPLEVSGEGRLTAFSRLIVKYRLVVAAACDVLTQTPAGSRLTRFGLLCRGGDDETLPGGLEGIGVRYIELLHAVSSAASLTDLLNAAGFCGLRPIRVDTLPLEDAAAEDEPSVPPICLVLEADHDADLAVFLRFLRLEASEDVFLGAYGLLPDA